MMVRQDTKAEYFSEHNKKKSNRDSSQQIFVSLIYLMSIAKFHSSRKQNELWYYIY